MTFQEWLKEHNACEPGIDWVADKTFEEFYATCDRGDWMCWLFFRTNPEDKRLLTLVKGLQVNEIRHLLKVKHSINAVDVAIDYGKGDATDEQLRAAADAAYAYYLANGADADYAAHCAADTAISAGATWFAAAAAAYATDATATADADAAYVYRRRSLARFADIFRKNIPIERINRVWEG